MVWLEVVVAELLLMFTADIMSQKYWSMEEEAMVSQKILVLLVHSMMLFSKKAFLFAITTCQLKQIRFFSSSLISQFGKMSMFMTMLGLLFLCFGVVFRYFGALRMSVKVLLSQKCSLMVVEMWRLQHQCSRLATYLFSGLGQDLFYRGL